MIMITLTNVLSWKLLLYFFMQTLCQNHVDVIYLKLKQHSRVLENEAKVVETGRVLYESGSFFSD